MRDNIIAANVNFVIRFTGFILGNFRRYSPSEPKIMGIKNAPYPNPKAIKYLARNSPLFPDQFLTLISAPDNTSEFGRLSSNFHQTRYEIQASRRYSAKPVIRIPAMNLILSSVKKDFEFAEPLADFVFFLGDSSFSLVIAELSFPLG